MDRKNHGHNLIPLQVSQANSEAIS